MKRYIKSTTANTDVVTVNGKSFFIEKTDRMCKISPVVDNGKYAYCEYPSDGTFFFVTNGKPDGCLVDDSYETDRDLYIAVMKHLI